jgi:endonuclease III
MGSSAGNNLRTVAYRQTQQRGNWRRRFGRIADVLVGEYSNPVLPDLGNFPDPVDEIFYIVLSAKTAEKLYVEAFRRLKSKFCSIEEIASAPLRSIRRCVECAGLGNKRAEQVKGIARRLISDLPPDPAAGLRRMAEEESFAYLTSLPGVGPKSAFCVMLMSLGRNVFPVDVNVYRIARRMGAMPAGLKHYEAQKLLPPMVPKRRSRELHIALVIHGRQVCLPRTPRCGMCVVRGFCAFPNKSAIIG